MKPSTLYTSPSVKTTTTELWCLAGHIHELQLDGADWSRNKDIEVRYYIDECFDGERGLAVYSVWLRGRPFMICREAGRGNKDDRDRFITDKELFQEFLKYIISLQPEPDGVSEAIDPDADIPELAEFYGHSFSAFYDPGLQPRFKEGDIVIARVMENHLRDAYAFGRTKWVETRCRIVTVNPLNPTHTYHLAQMDRRWETREEAAARGHKSMEMVDDPGHGEVGATGNDATVRPFSE